MSTRFIVGDALTELRKLPDASIDLVMSSPPFLALRSYLPADHPDKAKEIGSEATPGEFIDTLLDIVEECARMLAPHGSLAFELGDSYSGSGHGGYTHNDVRFDPRYVRGNKPSNTPKGPGWPLDKSLCLIPESFRWALAYGRNPFTGRETPPWRVRNVVRWHRPNPPVGALGDKFRPATTDLVIVCKSRTRYFDLDAVRGPGTDDVGHGVPDPHDTHRLAAGGHMGTHPNGAPPLDTWIIPTEPFKGAHYATFPSALVVKPVLAMCPERVCVECGEPSRRIVEARRIGAPDDATRTKKAETYRLNGTNQAPEVGWEYNRATLGWTDCGHDNWRRGMVLDPFAGSGTVLSVATGHGRDAIGIDLDERNAELARERVGMFLEEVTA
jgi:site-specific DNA-methyltransferase (adenine-specific)